MICLQCNKEFDAKRADARYCSDACSAAFRRNVGDNLSPSNVGDNPPNVGDNVGDNPVSQFVPNWKRLAAQYPDKIKTKQDALRFILFSLKLNHPEATFFLGGKVYGPMAKDGKDMALAPPYIKEFAQ